MVARTPPKQKKMVVAPLNPVLLRETLKKVDKCMARLQELQYTVAGGKKVISGVSLSPRSTRGYLRTSLRCKQESVRMNDESRKSPLGKKFPAAAGEWKRTSLPAMLVGETVGEILQASQFAREIVASIADKSKKMTLDDPKTPMTNKRNQRPCSENTELKARRHKEKQDKLHSKRLESSSPSLQRARSRINFKVSSPPNKKRGFDNEKTKYLANRVSPKNRPWAKKTVLFPNPLFQSTSSSHQHKFCKTRSPVIAGKKQAPHKFLIKSPPFGSKSQNKQTPHNFLIKSPPLGSKFQNKQNTPHKFLIKSPPLGPKFQVKIRSPPIVSLSPTRLSKKNSPKMSTVSKLRRSFSPSRLATRLASPLKSRRSVVNDEPLSSVLRRSFSPSRLAVRFVSPLKSRKSFQKDDPLSRLKQHPNFITSKNLNREIL